MKCNYCGFETKENFSFCPKCGKNVCYKDNFIEPVSLNPMADLVIDILRDKMFFVSCILLSVFTVMNTFKGGFDIIGILFTVFLWLTYASAKKGIANHKHLRCISGTYYAVYVIFTVFSILLLVATILCVLSIVLASLFDKDAVMPIMRASFNSQDFGYFTPVLLFIFEVSEYLFFSLYVILSVGFILLCIFVIRPVHRFLKSLYKSVETGIPVFTKVKTAKNFFLVWGIFCGIIALLALIINKDLYDFTSHASLSAANIIISILIKEYLLKLNFS